MSTALERASAELEQLNERITKLEVFLNTDPFEALSIIQQQLLRIQLDAMHTYSNVLRFRIANW